MKIAILSVSKKGKELSSKIKTLLEDDPTIMDVKTVHKNIKTHINHIFNEYDAIIGIMATGILIRSICSKLQDKYSDPAILSMDDNGKYVISLLSGHLGGANELSKKIAKLLDIQEIITTATDINGKIGIDTLANKYHWRIKNPKDILIFNKAILEDEKVYLLLNNLNNSQSSVNNYIDDLNNYLKNNTLEILDLKNNDNTIENIDKLALNNVSDEIIAIFNDNLLFLNQKKIVVGIGARAGISKEKVMIAIEKVMDTLNLPIERIDYLATVEMKKNEKGIIEASKTFNKPLKIVNTDEIKNLDSSDISFSEFVNKKFDIPGVCEPSALIVSGVNSKIIHKKIAIDGVTVAVASSQ
ncbi:cobalamin biosynthesis protein CbiG [Methanobrevibacter cuticularis]|uniref:Cobalamin biosynthesis protein CbiG n=2 Tax=Methanobrevibacter cuticularis TaxID=47311 RepID=A0A166CKY1_9EURY|nr:cobalamin biosynthesis protein CbiG [Methanobrevibacter cuticularis]